LRLALALCLAFEEVYKRSGRINPGGVRAFPMLALTGAMLYLVESHYSLAFVAGILALGAWLSGASVCRAPGYAFSRHQCPMKNCRLAGTQPVPSVERPELAYGAPAQRIPR
jgi:hypothetical protein